MKRLRFIKGKNDVLNLKNAVNNMLVTISPMDLIYYIHNEETKELIDSGQGKDLSALKNKVKEALVNLGVVFESEKRIRTKK